jgi:hypothetical protein
VRVALTEQQAEPQQFALRKPIAIALPLATGLRNDALAYDF